MKFQLFSSLAGQAFGLGSEKDPNQFGPYFKENLPAFMDHIIMFYNFKCSEPTMKVALFLFVFITYQFS